MLEDYSFHQVDKVLFRNFLAVQKLRWNSVLDITKSTEEEQRGIIKQLITNLDESRLAFSEINKGVSDKKRAIKTSSNVIKETINVEKQEQEKPPVLMETTLETVAVEPKDLVDEKEEGHSSIILESTLEKLIDNTMEEEIKEKPDNPTKDSNPFDQEHTKDKADCIYYSLRLCFLSARREDLIQLILDAQRALEENMEKQIQQLGLTFKQAQVHERFQFYKRSLEKLCQEQKQRDQELKECYEKVNTELESIKKLLPSRK